MRSVTRGAIRPHPRFSAPEAPAPTRIPSPEARPARQIAAARGGTLGWLLRLNTPVSQRIQATFAESVGRDLGARYCARELHCAVHQSEDSKGLRSLVFGPDAARIPVQLLTLALLDTQMPGIVFVLYFQAFGPAATRPYRGCVYLAAMDSMRSLVPPEYRKRLFHALFRSAVLLFGEYGYSTMHMWVCPPRPGLDYVFVSYEKDDSRISFQQLRGWYDELFEGMECERAVERMQREGAPPPIFDHDLLQLYLAQSAMCICDKAFVPTDHGENVDAEVSALAWTMKRKRQEEGRADLDGKKVIDWMSRETFGHCRGVGAVYDSKRRKLLDTNGGWRCVVSAARRCEGAASLRCCGRYQCPDALWEVRLLPASADAPALRDIATRTPRRDTPLSDYTATHNMLVERMRRRRSRTQVTHVVAMSEAIADELVQDYDKSDFEQHAPAPVLVGADSIARASEERPAPPSDVPACESFVAGVREDWRITEVFGLDDNRLNLREFSDLAVDDREKLFRELRRLESRLSLMKDFRGFLALDSPELARVRLAEPRSRFLPWAAVAPADDGAESAYAGVGLRESEEMASLRAPAPTCALSVPRDEQALFSVAQLDFARQAKAMQGCLVQGSDGRAHRRAVVLADGTGTGKTWCAMLLILDGLHNAIRRRSASQAKCLWVSASEQLQIGLRDELRQMWDRRLPSSSPLKQQGRRYLMETIDKVRPDYMGVAFVTYKQLTTSAGQVAAFLGDPARCESMVFFDEIHGVGAAESTVLALQRSHPLTRVVYMSATPISPRVDRLRILDRVGLWGPGSHFDSFEGFKRAFFHNCSREKGTLLEMLAMELKSQGRLFCRDMPHCTSSRMLPLPLCEAQRSLYDNVVDVLRLFRAAISSADERLRGMLSTFVNDCKQVIALLLMSFKAHNMLRWLREREERGFAVVIAIQSTGDRRGIAAEAAPPSFINSGGPCDRLRKWHDELRVECADAPREWAAFWASMPAHALDVLVQGMGESRIAEVSGRHVRVVGDPARGLRTQMRAPARDNQREIQAFCEGRKNVLVISETGCNGTRLNDLPGDARRRLFVLLHPCSERATATLQQFGRVHRNGQGSAPIYHFAVSDAPIEMRFLAELRDNIACLGAAVHASRGANGPLSGVVPLIYCDQGLSAAKTTRAAHLDKLRDLCSEMAPTSRDAHASINGFMNACMLLDLDEQGSVMAEFERRFFANCAQQQMLATPQFSENFLEGCVLIGRSDDPGLDDRARNARAVADANARHCLEASETGDVVLCGMRVRSFEVDTTSSFRAACALPGGRFFTHRDTGNPVLATPSGSGVWRLLEPDADVRAGARFVADATLSQRYDETADGHASRDVCDRWEISRGRATQTVHLVAAPWLHAWPALQTAIGQRWPPAIHRLRFVSETVIGIDLIEEAMARLRAASAAAA